MERMLICMMCVDGPICACENGGWMGLRHYCWLGLLHRKDVHTFLHLYMQLYVLCAWILICLLKFSSSAYIHTYICTYMFCDDFHICAHMLAAIGSFWIGSSNLKCVMAS